jgi:two-component system cell cycle response regulator DivK
MKKILVIDDNEKNRKLIKVILVKSGFQVIEAENGEEGINMAKSERPDLILMDIQMPMMDGINASKILKSNLLTKHIPVITLTSFAMKGDRERIILEAGCDGYISKPIAIKEFLNEVNKFIKDKSF